MSPTSAAAHLADAPLDLLTEGQRMGFNRFCATLDRLGHAAPDVHEEPLIDRSTLAQLISEAAGEPAARYLLAELSRLPDSRLTDTIADPMPWNEVAASVVIFDGTPVPFPGRLDQDSNLGEVMAAVQQMYPSLEPELIDPHVLPHAIDTLVTNASSSVVDLVHRNLGWWAVLTYALTVVGAAGSRPPGWAAWPLYVMVLAGTIGGWTLTVVGGCSLSQV